MLLIDNTVVYFSVGKQNIVIRGRYNSNYIKMTANVAAVNNPNRTYYYYELLLLCMVGISPIQANLVTDVLSFLVAVQPQYKIVHSSSLIPKLMFI